jgi:hypothetical protein
MYFPTSKTNKSGPGIFTKALSIKRMIKDPPQPKDVKFPATPTKSGM